MREGQEGVVIVIPTSPSDIPPNVYEESSRILTGDGTCSKENMNVSCFASERCGKDGGDRIHAMSLHDMKNSTYSVVSYDMHRGNMFVGCATAEPVAMCVAMYPMLDLNPQGHVIFNLCVNNEYRGCRMGPRLIHRLRQAIGCGPTYVFVSRSGIDSCNLVTAEVMETRIARLLHFYKSNGFLLMQTIPSLHVLMMR